jgi:predicted acyltransferase
MESSVNLLENQEQFLSKRLYSLDALRGFDMFWIIGAEDIIHGLAAYTHSPFWEAFSAQLRHPVWNGFTMYDLIFPLFIFLAGVSTPYSIGKALGDGVSKHILLRRVIKRGLILFAFGLIYNNGLTLRPLADIRFSSVLGRIGITYMLANMLYLYVKERWLFIWFAGLLIGYYVLLKFFSAPGFAPGDLRMEGNFASYVDRMLLPGKLSLGIHDTVGLFNNIPAIGNALAGIMVGNFLKKTNLGGREKALYLASVGLISCLMAQVWNLDFPINKNLWSSSFVLQTVGLSLVLFALFYYVIDVLGYKKWAFAFQVIGVNSILIYLSEKFLEWEYTAKKLFDWAYQLAGESLSPICIATAIVFIKWLFLRLLYQKNLFLRV